MALYQPVPKPGYKFMRPSGQTYAYQGRTTSNPGQGIGMMIQSRFDKLFGPNFSVNSALGARNAPIEAKIKSFIPQAVEGIEGAPNTQRLEAGSGYAKLKRAAMQSGTWGDVNSPVRQLFGMRDSLTTPQELMGGIQQGAMMNSSGIPQLARDFSRTQGADLGDYNRENLEGYQTLIQQLLSEYFGGR